MRSRFFSSALRIKSVFWEDLIPSVTKCSNATKMVATTFELARSLFHPALSLSARHFVERHLPATAASWVRAYGRTGAIHCYRNNRNALLLHLGLLDDNADVGPLFVRGFSLVIFRSPTYGVQTPPEAQDLKFRVVKTCSIPRVALTAWLVSHPIAGRTAFQLPLWLIRDSAAAKRSRGTRPALTLNVGVGLRTTIGRSWTATIAAQRSAPTPSTFKIGTWQIP